MKPPDDKIPEGFMSDQHNVVIANEVRLVDAAGNTRLLLTTSSGTPSLQFLSGNGTVGMKADLDQEGRGAFRIQNPEAQGPVAGIEVVHCNVTAHPTAAWTFQQLREASDHSYRFLIHDRDAIFSAEVQRQLKAFGLRVLRKPVRAPNANAYCERLVGSVRRECLDFMIPLGEKNICAESCQSGLLITTKGALI